MTVRHIPGGAFYSRRPIGVAVAIDGSSLFLDNQPNKAPRVTSFAKPADDPAHLADNQTLRWTADRDWPIAENSTGLQC